MSVFSHLWKRDIFCLSKSNWTINEVLYFTLENKHSWWNKLATSFLHLPFGPKKIQCFYNIAITYCKWVLLVCLFCGVFFWQKSSQSEERERAKRNITEGHGALMTRRAEDIVVLIRKGPYFYGKGANPKFHAQNCNSLQLLVLSRNTITVKLCKLINPISKN